MENPFNRSAEKLLHDLMPTKRPYNSSSAASILISPPYMHICLLELSYRRDENEKNVQKEGKGCILEDNYLAWYNGEPIDEEVR